MKVKKCKSFYVVRLEKDEEIVGKIRELAKKYRIKGAFFFGLGVANNLTLGYFDARRKTYIKRKFKGEYEFTGLSGNISCFGKEIVVHCHATIADEKFNAFGGHVFEAFIPATCEILVMPLTRKLTRKRDAITGLNLLDLKF